VVEVEVLVLVAVVVEGLWVLVHCLLVEHRNYGQLAAPWQTAVLLVSLFVFTYLNCRACLNDVV